MEPKDKKPIPVEDAPHPQESSVCPEPELRDSELRNLVELFRLLRILSNTVEY